MSSHIVERIKVEDVGKTLSTIYYAMHPTIRNSFALQWLGLRVPGLILGQGTKILQATWPKKKKNYVDDLYHCHRITKSKI